jgi:hypothetical protein
VAVDSSGNLYIADAVAGGGNTTARLTSLQSATGVKLNNPTGVIVDGAGNPYVTDANNNLFEKVTTAATPLLVPSTNVGATSATTQSITLENIRNQPLSIASLTITPDFPFASSSICTAANSAQTWRRAALVPSYISS